MDGCRARRLLALVGTCFGPLAACGSAPSKPPIGPTPIIQFDRHGAAVAVRDTVRFTVIEVPPPAYVPDLEWFSSNTRVATVNGGLVRGIGQGRAWIFAAGQGAKDSASIQVLVGDVAGKMAVVRLAQHGASVTAGDTTVLNVVPALPPGYVPPVVWTSSDTAVVTVAPTAALAATLSGIRPGRAVILLEGAGLRDSCAITVTARPAGS